MVCALGAMCLVGESVISATENGATSGTTFGTDGSPIAEDQITGNTPLPARPENMSGSPGIPGGIGSLVRTVIALGVMIGVLWLANRGLRRMFPDRVVPRLPDGMVEVLGRAPLLARQSVVLVRVGPRLLLVSVTPNGPVPLTRFDDPEQIRLILDQVRGIRTSGTTDATPTGQSNSPGNGTEATGVESATFESEYRRALRNAGQRPSDVPRNPEDGEIDR
ncbi:MAG: flagellar biosynthetic protein FliO [Planctomycetia bacterium]|nr:flagellar biosynthetic protein FliO [Planctomycetia bacterium]